MLLVDVLIPRRTDLVFITAHSVPTLRNIRASFYSKSSSTLCSGHFPESSFEAQFLISNSLGISMKIILLPDAFPTIFNADAPEKKQKTDDQRIRSRPPKIPHHHPRRRLQNGTKVFTEKWMLQGLAQLVLVFFT